MDAYITGIDPATLPQTIRNAIYVTHEHGMQYLWADTLCTVQDSDEDKRRELARMHRIYRDAHLTIIASNARKVSESFLQVRSDTAMRDVVLPFVCPPARGGGPPESTSLPLSSAPRSYSYTRHRATTSP